MEDSYKYGSKEVIEKIRGYAKDNNIAKSNLAIRAGLPDKTLANFWEDSWNPTIKTLQKIESVIPQNYRPLSTNLNESQELNGDAS